MKLVSPREAPERRRSTQCQPMMEERGKQVRVKMLPQRTQLPPVKQVPAVWKSPLGAEVERPLPPECMCVRAEDVVSTIRLRTQPGPSAKGVVYQCAKCTSGTRARCEQVHEVIGSILAQFYCGLGTVKACLRTQGVPL